MAATGEINGMASLMASRFENRQTIRPLPGKVEMGIRYSPECEIVLLSGSGVEQLSAIQSCALANSDRRILIPMESAPSWETASSGATRTTRETGLESEAIKPRANTPDKTMFFGVLITIHGVTLLALGTVRNVRRPYRDFSPRF